MGPLMLDCQAEELLPEEREKIAHPVTGGLILFSRNYAEPKQLKALVQDIRKSAKKPILIAVDHEGGRVQRFRKGFTHLPPMGKIASLAASTEQATSLAKACGSIMAYELKQYDIDFSFAPVLDVNGLSQVIGDRSFSASPTDIVTLVNGLLDGLSQMNMPSVGKHFPGHGSVEPDSHVALPEDTRSFDEIASFDLTPFATLIDHGRLDGIMPAHVIYSQVDENPAGFSPFWLQQVLKKQLGFTGAIFSDDLSMHGASVVGDYISRAKAAINAGCDMVLACNNSKGAESILDALPHTIDAPHSLRAFAGRSLSTEASANYESALEVYRRFGLD